MAVRFPPGGSALWSAPGPGSTLLNEEFFGTAGGSLSVWLGSAWTRKPVKTWSGSAWFTAVAKRWSGSAWVLT